MNIEKEKFYKGEYVIKRINYAFNLGYIAGGFASTLATLLILLLIF